MLKESKHHGAFNRKIIHCNIVHFVGYYFIDYYLTHGNEYHRITSPIIVENNHCTDISEFRYWDTYCSMLVHITSSVDTLLKLYLTSPTHLLFLINGLSARF